ncbi:MAG: chemotaxis protein CheA [Planctomycetota bacterium]
MSEHTGQPGDSISEEMAQYLQVFMDESDEQLEGLTEVLLVLENEPDNVEHLNEAFRLIHSIKGSAGMMGLDSIAALTHHLESRFERFRSGVQRLDEPTMNLVLRCIDFLRECIRRLRAGRPLERASDLLRELSERTDAAGAEARPSTPPAAESPGADAPEDQVAVENVAVEKVPVEAVPAEGGGHHLAIRFEPGLPLADLKARLILARLSNIGDLVRHQPTIDEIERVESIEMLEIVLVTEHGLDAVRAAADVDGVSSIEVVGEPRADGEEAAPEVPDEAAPAGLPHAERVPVIEVIPRDQPRRSSDEPAADTDTDTDPDPDTETDADDHSTLEAPASASAPVPEAEPPRAETPVAPESRVRQVETMRVDIERLDGLMNLAGELVVNRARFVQVSGQVAPVFGRRNVASRTRDFGETLRRTIEHLRSASTGEWTTDIEELTSGLELLEEQAEVWDKGRRGFIQIGEAIDQLTRIAESLQQSVLDTRMVPVAPLFTRFKRVVRDLARERGKKVDLRIRGEKTELDKRMIDELGDPLVHLVRNSLDHGLEAPDVRQARGKPETGTITLEASHSGNTIFIRVRDDGGGIDPAKIRAKIVERGLLTASAANELPDGKALEYIWNPGFSTASQLTDISGRGVGMDAVRTRITDLNGQIDVDSIPGEGTTFTIRLPLTLAIINSLLIRARGVTFSIPIDDVREIVAVQPTDVITVHGKQTIDVRGEFVPLVGMDEVFDWNDLDGAEDGECGNGDVHAVILQSGRMTMGLRADALIGSQDIVIKSLSENFVHIRGLSGASILGDGGVCLMLDVATIMDLAVRRAAQEHRA